MAIRWAVLLQERVVYDHVISEISRHDSEAEADAEADRRNEFNPFKDEYYFVRRVDA